MIMIIITYVELDCDRPFYFMIMWGGSKFYCHFFTNKKLMDFPRVLQLVCGSARVQTLDILASHNNNSIPLPLCVEIEGNLQDPHGSSSFVPVISGL
jgi:hypothetical protein